MDVFLGSSRMLFDLRLGFAALVDSLVDPALDYCEKEVVARMWENESYAIERNRSKQAAYDEMIRHCDLAFFLVDGYLGNYTLHEYLTAVDSLSKSGKPSITIWVRSGLETIGRASSILQPSSVRSRDANTRLLLESATVTQGVEVRDLVNPNAVLVDMLELMVRILGPVPLYLREDSVWVDHKRLASLVGVPTSRVGAFTDWLRGH